MRQILLLSFLAVGAIAADPVLLTVYFEALCPDSRDLFIHQLYPAYSKLSSIINLELVPFGNAKYSTQNKTDGQFDVTFTCQHGANECLGNEIQGCAIATLNAAQSLELVYCMFSSSSWQTPTTSGQTCATSLKLDWTFLKECANGPLGRGLHLTNGEATLSLNPAQTWIPWVTVNGKHSKEIQTLAETNMVKLICDSYTGTKPTACA